MNANSRQSGLGARLVQFLLIGISLVAIGVAAAAFLPGALSSPDDVTTLTHTIARGDLRMTVMHRLVCARCDIDPRDGTQPTGWRPPDRR